MEKALEVAHDATDDAEIHSDLGTAYFYQGRYSDAVKEDEKAVKISPKEYELVGNLADAYRWAGRKKETRQAYESAIELANKHLEIKSQRCRSTRKSGPCTIAKNVRS